MPITLGCPSCGKRFRARDESAGKKVKCPYCQAAVPVPTAEESENAPAPAPPPPPPEPAFDPDPPPPPARQPRRAPSTPDIASPEDWGALPTGPAPTAPVPAAPPRSRSEAPLPFEPEPEPAPPAPPPPREKKGKPRPKPAAPEAKKEPKTPEQVLARSWASVRRGLFWVQFALLFVALIGFVPLGKTIYTRSAGELPKGEGWIQIDGYINSGGPSAIPLSKTDEINLLTYGLPAFLAGFFMSIGRFFSGGGPRNSGTRMLFSLSGLFTFVAFIALFAFVVCTKVPFKEEIEYCLLALVLTAPLAEFWFLTAITASGLALKRPKVARAVGFAGFVLFVLPIAATLGWDQYVKQLRPKNPDADVLLYEQVALAVGWLLLVASYWRAVGGVRSGAREFIQSVEDKDDPK